MVPFLNGRREGANPSSRVIVPPDLEFPNQFCWLVILISSLRTCTPGDRSHSYRKDRWRLHFIFEVIQVEWETVMTESMLQHEVHSTKKKEQHVVVWPIYVATCQGRWKIDFKGILQNVKIISRLDDPCLKNMCYLFLEIRFLMF